MYPLLSLHFYYLHSGELLRVLTKENPLYPFNGICFSVVLPSSPLNLNPNLQVQRSLRRFTNLNPWITDYMFWECFLHFRPFPNERHNLIRSHTWLRVDLPGASLASRFGLECTIQIGNPNRPTGRFLSQQFFVPKHTNKITLRIKYTKSWILFKVTRWLSMFYWMFSRIMDSSFGHLKSLITLNGGSLFCKRGGNV